MRNSIFISVIVLASACSNEVTNAAAPKQESATDFEMHIVLPDGAADIIKYDRYYYFSGNQITGEFVRAEGGSGRVIIVKNLEDLPHIMDGGCDVINLKGDRRHMQRAKASCNGDA